MSKGYIAYVLSEKSRDLLLDKYPPKYPDVIAHHVTVQYPAHAEESLPSKEATLKVVGYVDNGKDLEALVVSINGITMREDNSIYHITWSLDKSAGRRPVDSNDLLQKQAFTLHLPLVIEATPEFIPAGS